MAKTRLLYPPQFRRQMAELAHAGRTPEELAAHCTLFFTSARKAAFCGLIPVRPKTPRRRSP